MYTYNAFDDDQFMTKYEPGPERCEAVCYLQSFAALLLPITACGFGWCCCGLGNFCARGDIVNMINDTNKVSPSPTNQSMSRTL